MRVSSGVGLRDGVENGRDLEATSVSPLQLFTILGVLAAGGCWGGVCPTDWSYIWAYVRICTQVGCSMSISAMV